jgi:hypothetical protein
MAGKYIKKNQGSLSHQIFMNVDAHIQEHLNDVIF